VGLYSLLILALFCAAISLVYYLRVLRLFWNASQTNNTRVIQCNGLVSNKLNSAIYYAYSLVPTASTRVQLTSACVVLLVVIPLFLIKPFVL
jgi:NADH:ubiquinone oxidoreductase subunit 2 (subunit N)